MEVDDDDDDPTFQVVVATDYTSILLMLMWMLMLMPRGNNTYNFCWFDTLAFCRLFFITYLVVVVFQNIFAFVLNYQESVFFFSFSFSFSPINLVATLFCCAPGWRRFTREALLIFPEKQRHTHTHTHSPHTRHTLSWHAAYFNISSTLTDEPTSRHSDCSQFFIFPCLFSSSRLQSTLYRLSSTMSVSVLTVLLSVFEHMTV